MFKTLLCIPPDYDRNFPPLGTPALSAFLKSNGFACRQLDLNIRYRDFLAGFVSGASSMSVEERLFFLKPLLTKFFAEKLADKYYTSILPRKSDHIFPQLPYDNNTNSSFYFCERLLSSEYLWRYLEDAQENTFLQFYCRDGVLQRLAHDNVGLLGISIISPSQAVAGLTLGLMVKRAFSHIHVTIGGQWPTLFRNAIARRKDLFRCFDSVVAFEGESALCAMARCLEKNRTLPAIPNVMTADTASKTLTPYHEPMDALPCPDFDGLDLAAYDAMKEGQVSLTFETSRGCYWSKCAYCVDLPLPKPSYRAKRPDLVAQDMETLKNRYHAQYLLFGDPGLSPRQMRAIADAMISAGVSIEWWTMCRLDPGFTAALFERAHKAGLRQINFGFESANDRICRFLDKGNLAERSARVIRECAEAGIKVDLQTMLGLPGERFEDGMDTIDFLISHKQYISHVTFNTYYLTPGNHVYNDPARFGIECEDDGSLPFRFFMPFRNKRGMDMEQALVLEKLYHSLLSKHIAAVPAGPAQVRDMVNGYVDFSLNGESCRMSYERDARTDTYVFQEYEPA